MDVSSDSGEWAFSGSTIAFQNSAKFQSGPDAFKRNEAEQR